MKKSLLLLLVLAATGLSSVHAYDFSAVAPTGQTLYFNISGDTASVTYPGTWNAPYGDYTKPSGALTIPDSVTYSGHTYLVTAIEWYAFRDCSGLTSVTIPNSVTSIRDWAFPGCSGLTSVTIPNSVTHIGESAFEDCSGLTSMTVETGNAHYDSRNDCNAIIETSTSRLIAGCRNTVIPHSVTAIGNHAFAGCSGLTSMTIPDSVTAIGRGAFYGCSGLASVAIPNSVTTIGAGAFNGCTSLTSVAIPNSVTTIGEYAFSGCSGLAGVTIPNSVDTIGREAFYGCSGLTSITIPNSLTAIEYGVFYGCSGLTSVTIPNSVTAINGSAFYNCSSLTSATIPNSVTTVGGSAFYNCSGLTAVTIPNSVATIRVKAFEGCSGLTSVTIGNSVTTIGDWAFNDCGSLTELTVLATEPPTIGANTFGGVNRNIPVYIPCGRAQHYQAQGPWNEFNGYQEVSGDVLTVESNNELWGTAEIQQAHTCTSPTAIIRANANSGYRFVRWNDDNTDNPRTVTVTEDATYTAYFDASQTQSIDEAEQVPVISASGSSITVADAQSQTLSVFDIAGRVIVREQAVEGKRYALPRAGVYMVKIGNHAAQKVVVLQ